MLAKHSLAPRPHGSSVRGGPAHGIRGSRACGSCARGSRGHAPGVRGAPNAPSVCGLCTRGTAGRALGALFTSNYGRARGWSSHSRSYGRLPSEPALWSGRVHPRSIRLVALATAVLRTSRSL